MVGPITRAPFRWPGRLPLAVAAALLLALACVASFSPLVRSAAAARAEARGVTLHIDGVRPGWFSVHLLGVDASIPEVPAASLQLERVVVRLTPWLSLREVSIESGRVGVDGSLDEIGEQLRRYRDSRPVRSGEASGSRASLPVAGSRLQVTWREPGSDGEPHRLDGLSFARRDGKASFGCDEADVSTGRGRWTARGVSAELSLGETGPQLERLTAREVIARVSLATAAAAPDAGPATAPTPTAIAPAPGASARLALRNRARPAADKTPQPTSPGHQPLRRLLSLGAGQAWTERAAQLARLRALLSRSLSAELRVESPALRLELQRGAATLNLGPAPFHLQRVGDVLETAFSPPAAANGKRLAVTGRLPLSEQPLEVSFEGGPISLRTLGVRERDFGLLGVDETELTLATQVTLSAQGRLDVSASGELRGLALEHPALAPEPLRDIDLAWAGAIELDLGERRLKLTDGQLRVEQVRLEADAELSARDDDLAVQLDLRVPSTPCQSLYEAAPPALLPLLEGLRLGGKFELSSSVSFDTAAPKDTLVDWKLGNECKVVETPEAVDPRRFAEPFQHFVLDADGRATEISTGPTTDRWVPLGDISPNMETALLVCEDSRFFSHRGFDNKAIRDSIISNLRAGHFVRGGSTLTMQLAKNLYLGREKTLSRKLQEAVLTLLLEERLSKQDILELYLNVVEFGPGIYGIREAAQHYFNSHPGELSLAQALFFGSILPRPKAKHFADSGAMNDGWAQHLQYLMRIARKINRISDDELEAGLGERLRFGQPHVGSDSDFLFGAPLFEMSDG